MGRLTTSFVLGYHGCDAKVASSVINGSGSILESDRDYDWLGPGAYFWEADPQRAKEWADWKVQRGEYSDAAVVGAVIDLRDCLDLTNREDVEILQAAHRSLHDIHKRADLPLPENKNLKDDPNSDMLLRYLDCAVFRHLHRIVEDAGLPPYDTVRGLFTEGREAFPGSAILEKTHTQIAVRSPDCIKGYFYPLVDGVIVT